MHLLAACTDGKRLTPSATLRMREHVHAAPIEAARTWRNAANVELPCLPARQLYKGVGWSGVRAAAEAGGHDLSVVSAGFGLVAAEQLLPGYSATFLPRHADSVPGSAAGRRTWWQALGGS